MNTLTVFLLDKNSSITDTAAHLFVHKNTVKYRLHKAGTCWVFAWEIYPSPKT
ncbi:MAG: helix-turn-helix domain-containing protein [Oscillospiraceae bacterium]